MISVQIISDRVLSRLDAESSDRYTFDRDIKPAINSSIEWVVAVFNKAFADKKLSEENLRELIQVVIYQTNSFSRIGFDPLSLGFSVWSVIKINPEAEVYPTNATITPVSNAFDSLFRDDLSYIRSKFSAKRLTMEQWEDKTDNIFEAGNDKLSNSFKSYSYVNFASYSSSSYNTTVSETEIAPAWENKFVGVSLLKYPTQVALIADNIQFPQVLTNLIVEKTLNFISTKQGDQTNLYGITSKEVQTLVQLMV